MTLYKAQLNLSVEDMLYSGHLSIADTIFENPVAIFYWKLPLCSGRLSKADTFFENRWCPLLRGSIVCSIFKANIMLQYTTLISYWIVLSNLKASKLALESGHLKKRYNRKYKNWILAVISIHDSSILFHDHWILASND